jgi:hypothetical protein
MRGVDREASWHLIPRHHRVFVHGRCDVVA